MVSLALSPFDDVEAVKSTRRVAPRVSFGPKVCYLSDSRIVIANSGDVSMSGAFIETDAPDPKGIQAVLRLDHEGQTLVLEVEVCRVSFLATPGGQGRGMGLRFLDLDRDKRRFLARYVAAHHPVS